MRGRFVLLAALVLLPLAAPALAQTSTASTPIPPRNSVWTVMNTVEAVVNDNYATVKVIADIGNRGPDPEFPFQVRVPDDAFVTGLTIVRDGKVYEARIEDRAAARQEYEEHKRREMTGGLVEKQRGSQVYAFLVNVAEFESVRATLTYERYLAADQGVFELPLEAPVSGFGQDLGARFDVTVRHRDGVTDLWGHPAGDEGEGRDGALRLTHAVGPRPDDEATPFSAFYTLDPTAGGGRIVATVQDGKGYFAHRFRAPPDARDLPLDLVLVMDVSGSMSGLKMQQMQDAAAQVVNLLKEEDRLHLVLFSSDARSPWQGLRNATPALRREAGDEVRAMLAAGGTNIEAGIRDGFQGFAAIDWAREEGRLPALAFLTDGQPSSGIQDRGELRRLAREANARGVNVFALAFGGDADWSLVAGLAADGNGTALKVPEGEGAEVDLRRFLAALTTPVLKDVRVLYQGAFEAHRRAAPILFAGSELLVVGTFDPALQQLRATVTGRAPDGPRTYNVSEPIAPAAASWLPRLVAYQEIRRLQELIAAEGARQAWVDQVKALALKHGFVTDYTSLVVTLEARPLRGCEGCEFAQTADAAGAPAAAVASGSGDRRLNSDLAQRTSGGSAPSVSPWPGAPQQELSRDGAQRTPGFEGLAALAAVGVALLALRRRR